MMRSRRSFLAAGAAAAGAALAVAPQVARAAPAPAAPTPVRLIGFLSAGSLPYWIAGDQGFFARENLAVSLTQTPGSIYQYQHLSGGDFDVATSAIDNIIAYDEGQGEAVLPYPADFAAFLGGDSGFLTLWGRPEIKTIADLKGKTLAVDALTTGYAFVLYRMLEIKAQLSRSDYALDGVGGTNKRLDALLASSGHAAALLSPPFDQTARAAGMTFLGTATDVIGPYQASCLVARRAWLARNRDTAVRMARAVIAATAWMYDPANHDAAVAVLMQHTNQKADTAAPLFAAMTSDPKNGFSPTCALDLAGMRTVLELRSTYGVPKKLLTDPLRYYAADIDRRARLTPKA